MKTELHQRVPSQTRGLNVVLALSIPGFGVLALFFLFPLIWILRISFYETEMGTVAVSSWSLTQYIRFLGDWWYLENVLWETTKVSVLSTAASVVLAYPLALFLSKSVGVLRHVLQIMILSPLIIGLVSLVFGWIVILRGGGIINSVTMALGIVDAPVKYLYDIRAIYILMIYIGVPYVVMTLMDNIDRMDRSLLEAARNAGAARWQVFSHVTLPLTMPGVNAGVLLVFALNFSAFSIPLMVGSPITNMMGLVVYKQAMQLGDMPFASAISIIMTLVSALVLFIFARLCTLSFSGAWKMNSR